MRVKFAAVPLPPLRDKTVLDIGCDFGAWCIRAREEGALRVLGLDRGRKVAGEFINLAQRNRDTIPGCDFMDFIVGEQYHQLGLFDVVLMLNVYHHAYNVSGDHNAIWYWLWRQTVSSGVLMWESPVDLSDHVARTCIRPELGANYTEAAIRKAASQYFDIEDVGPGWVAPRVVWRCHPRARVNECWMATVRDGAGGASKAFNYAGCRRQHEIARTLGYLPYQGSLNLITDVPFDFGSHYYRAPLLDVVKRGIGLDSPWALRPCRYYPIEIEGVPAHALRCEGEHYPLTLVELVAPEKLRDLLGLETGQQVHLTRNVPIA
jgi:SAM-dependent methyltransferase